ncbi:MAG: TonB-dependent receptor [Bacteroidales bacterium]|nr:TonB-dependent receptor [Bacteroidales bacterium]
MRFLLLNVILFLNASSYGRINGYVFDNTSDEPLPGVTILAGEDFYTVTDSTGHFTLETDTMPVTLSISSLGYKPVQIKVVDHRKPVYIRLEISEVTLSEVTVSSTAFRQRLHTLSGHVSVVTGEKLSMGNPAWLNSSLNNLPGIFMQSGTLTTNRLVIRGIGSRNPYSTNRVKAYFEGIPLTTGEGVTTIEDIDPSIIGKIEIIRGPASGIYGAGLGGAVNISAEREATDQTSVALHYTTGSFGLHKTSATVSVNKEKSNFAAGFNYLNYNGFRENNETNRYSFHLLSHTRFEKSHLSLFLYHVNLHAYIPSSLSEEDFTDNPGNAAANWQSIKGYENYDKTLGGITYTKRFNNNFYNHSTVYASFFNQYESRPFNILDDQSFMYGGRSKFTLSFRANTFAFGTELFSENYLWDIFETNDGLKGQQQSSNNEVRFYYNIFLHYKAELLNKLTLTAGMNYNNLAYSASLHHLTDSTIDDEKHSFNPVFSPHAGLNIAFSEAVSLYLLVSHGFSPPSVEETLDPEGIKNTAIKPESGWNHETGVRGMVAGRRINYELSFYSMNVKNLLVTKRLSEEIFTGTNAGKTVHYGLEASVNYFFGNSVSGQDRVNAVSVSAYYSKNRFRSFEDDGNDYSGNLLPGIPEYMLTIGFSGSKNSGLSYTVNLQHTGSMFLNDSNNGKTKSYTLLNAKVSYKILFKEKYSLDLFASVYNLLNMHYASMILVNAPENINSSPRYYYPGLPVNFNAGIKIRLNKKPLPE